MFPVGNRQCDTIPTAANTSILCNTAGRLLIESSISIILVDISLQN